MIGLAAACVAIGLAPIAFWPAIAAAMGAWRPDWPAAPAPAPLFTLGLVHVALAVLLVAATWWLLRRSRHQLRHAVTWDCGYMAPTARMQYTAESFAGIITAVCAILRPRSRRAALRGAPGISEQDDAHPETVPGIWSSLEQRDSAHRHLREIPARVCRVLLYLPIIAGLGFVVLMAAHDRALGLASPVRGRGISSQGRYL
jgi:hypothetical protein